MSRGLADSREWVRTGTELVAHTVSGVDDATLEQPTDLPGWSGKHLLAHLAANADALRNLAHWARTGEKTPMYSSPDQRGADIEAGAKRSAEELIEWFRTSSQALEQDFDATTDEAWEAEVLTAQGRTVPFSEVPWMRTREVLVHATDFSGGPSFAELPPAALVALADDIVGKRSGTDGHPALRLTATDTGDSWSIGSDGDDVSGTLADIVAYLAGRPHGALVNADGDEAPQLPAWL